MRAVGLGCDVTEKLLTSSKYTFVDRVGYIGYNGRGGGGGGGGRRWLSRGMFNSRNGQYHISKKRQLLVIIRALHVCILIPPPRHTYISLGNLLHVKFKKNDNKNKSPVVCQ